MQSTSSAPSTDTTIIRTGSDGRLRYTPAQRGELLEAFERSGLSAMAFSWQHGISCQHFIAWLRKRRQSGEALPPGVPAFAEVMLQEAPPSPSAALRIVIQSPQSHELLP
jgi:hypothetical protein